jgi:hypothetical protein
MEARLSEPTLKECQKVLTRPSRPAALLPETLKLTDELGTSGN